MGRIRFLFLLVFLLASVSAYSFRLKNRVIEKKYIACLVYSKSTSYPSKVAEFILRDAVLKSLKTSDNLVLVSRKKIASYFKDNNINKKNFSNLMKENPLTSYFITARIYFSARWVNLRHNVILRVSVYLTKNKVKRIKRFFINMPFYRWKEASFEVAKKSAALMGEAISYNKLKLDSTPVYLSYADGAYYLSGRGKEEKALASLLKALKTAEECAYSIAEKAAELLVGLSKNIEGLKKPGDNNKNSELLAALYYFKKQHFKKALTYLKSYLAKNQRLINKTIGLSKIQNAEIKNGRILAITKKGLKVFDAKNLKLLFEKKDENFRNARIISKNLLCIENSIIDLNAQDNSPIQSFLLKKMRLSSLYIKGQDNKYFLFIKGKTKNIKLAIKSPNIKTKADKSLFFVSSGNTLYCFNLHKSSLSFKKEVKAKIDKINISGSFVFIQTRQEGFIINKFSGRLYKKISAENALELYLRKGFLIKRFKNKVTALNIYNMRKWEKHFTGFNILKIIPENTHITCFLSGGSRLSYKINISYSGKTYYRNILFGSLVNAEMKKRIFIYRNKIEYRAPKRACISSALRFYCTILNKLPDKNKYYENTFRLLMNSPTDIKTLFMLYKEIKNRDFIKRKKLFIESFIKVYKDFGLEIPQGKACLEFICSYINYPFLKMGYSAYLKLKIITDFDATSLVLGSNAAIQCKIGNLIITKSKALTETISLKTGKVLWRMKNFTPLSMGRYAKDRVVLFNKKDNLLICVDPSNGRLIWSKMVKGYAALVNTTNKAIFFVKTTDDKRELLRVGLLKGKLTKKEIGRSRLIFCSKGFYLIENSKLSYFKAFKLIWSKKTKSRINDILTSKNKTYIIGKKSICAVLKKSGNIIKRFNLVSDVTSYFLHKSSLYFAISKNKGRTCQVIELKNLKLNVIYEGTHRADHIFTSYKWMCILDASRLYIIDLKRSKVIYSFKRVFTSLTQANGYLTIIYKTLGILVYEKSLYPAIFHLYKQTEETLILKGGIIIDKNFAHNN